MWTLAEASVECRVMSGATAACAGEAGDAEQREMLAILYSLKSEVMFK